jgi:hypothetical protein
MNIHAILRQINRDLVPQFEERLREHLQSKDREWLVEQIVRLTLDAHSLQENDRKIFMEAKEKRRAERRARLQEICLTCDVLESFLYEHRHFTRESMMNDGYLLDTAYIKGTNIIDEKQRTQKGNQLLTHAKDILFGLLFGDENTNTHFNRKEREMLTLVLPRYKAQCLDFMKATTELSALGTWQDPDSVSNDAQADNVILEVEFGEVEGELIGKGIIAALSLINNLEVNEQILYGRMINIEQSTLIM